MSRIVFITFIIFMPSYLFAQFEGGTGTISDPYQIKNLEQLQMITEYLESSFILTSDIDASATKEWNGGQGFKPIGSQEMPFKRSFFDGNNHRIKGLYINRPEEDHVGLFGYTEGSTIKNIILEQVNIKGGNGTGSLTGIAEGSNIFNVSVSGNVLGGADTGGLAGSAPSYDDYGPDIIQFSSLRYANTEVNVEGGNNVGGLVGSTDGSINNSYVTGNVEGNENVGGLVGFKMHGTISSSFATGNIIGIIRVGGIAGSCDDYALGSIREQCSYRNTYFTGNIEGDEMVGGLIGDLRPYDVLLESYTLGNVIGSITSGAVTGNFQGYGRAVYWDSTMSDQASAIGSDRSTGITALKTQEMKGDSALKYMQGFDFENVWISVEGNYPELLWTKTPGWIEQKYPVGVDLNEYENGIDAISFKWFTTDTVESYHLQVSEDPVFENLILDQQSITEDSVEIALNLESHTKYYWHVRAKNEFGYNPWSIRAGFETMITTSIEEEPTPQQVYLHQNYPNPFNPSTTISYELSEAGLVKLEIFDLLGERIAILVNENKSSGVHSTRFDATGLSSGFYIYRLETNTATHMKKLLFLK
ncbi:T9SS type A sorting domain-containing protein [Gracilimonas sp.]|uniref:T9SS type A sorting domain-containing protein n=1 Tax=Gracilimonas sp. TaxID=1974203 RepID=UPI003BACCCAF